MVLSENKRLPRIGILIINYNQWELTRKCVESLLESDKVEVVIGLVDNNSEEIKPDWVDRTPEVVFFESSENNGFIAGNIKAYETIREKNVDYVFMLNNDTEVEPDTLRLLVTNFSDHPDTGLVTPVITYAGNRSLIWHAGGTFIPRRMDVKQLYKTVSELPENAVEVDQISGCAMMMTAEMFETIGYQDTDPFMYHEDIEKCLRSVKLGFRNYLVPGARIIHHVSISAGGVLSPLAVYFTHRNRYIYAKRNLKRSDLFGFRLYYFANTLAKTIIYPLKKCGHLVFWMWLALIHGVLNKPYKKPEKLFLRDR